MTDKNTYEGMFLVDAGETNFETASEPVRTVLDRSEAEVLSMNPWDERRLAYDIKGRKRGLYVLAYFKLDPTKMTDLERDAELNEGVIRMLVLRRDKVTDEQLAVKTPAMVATERVAEAEASAAASAAAAEAEAASAEDKPAEAGSAGEQASEPAAAPAEEPAAASAEEPAAAPAEEPAAAPAEEPAVATAEEPAEAPEAKDVDADSPAKEE